MKILGIETSCDETAAAVIEDGTRILSNVVVSQIDIHAAYGGVVPEIAARSHIEAILPVIDQTLENANLTWNDIDKIAVTHTPGLLGSLLIGTLTARTLAILHDLPLYPTHHLKSHIYANWLERATKGNLGNSGNLFQGNETNVFVPSKREPRQARLSALSSRRASLTDKKLVSCPEETPLPELPKFPLIALVVSGGHTQLIYMNGHNHFEIIGTTRDDAVGEVFDKIAKILGLPYPGGPSITAAAKSGNPHKYSLPHPKVPELDFSFSGLKTAVLRAVQKDLDLPISTPSHELAAQLSPQQVADFAASFQNTAIDILVEKLAQAVAKYQPASVLLAGGVAANSLLRKKVQDKITEYGLEENHIRLFFPAPQFSTDNAAMVASAAYFAIKAGAQPTDPYNLDISPRSGIS